MSITDELIAKLEAIAGEDFPLTAIDTEALRALLAERAELKLDAGRYRWLREQASGICAADHALRWTWSEGAYGAPDYTLDTAIDAVMQAAK
jgi:hypothetical protein